MTAQRQLDGFLRRYDPEIARIGRGALAKMRKRFSGALELVYDNYNALVIGYSPTERAGDAVCSIALYPRWVRLFFLNGATLPDPDGLLDGAGSRVRSVQLASAKTLDEPPVRALVEAAIERAHPPFERARRRRTVIKSISKRQRPRRPEGGRS